LSFRQRRPLAQRHLDRHHHRDPFNRGWSDCRRLCVAPFFRGGFTVPEHFPAPDPDELADEATSPAGGTELTTFGSGCFWCTEAVFQQMKGVTKVVSGYSGGHVKSPTYEQVCTGTTGHAEVVQVTFDPAVVSYPELLEGFSVP
jgi:hypothetical protein